MRLLIIIFITVLLSGCSAPKPVVEESASEKPEVLTIPKHDLEKKKDLEVLSFPADYKYQVHCPFIGLPIARTLFFDYKGYRIYTCCKGCLRTLKEYPEYGIKALKDRKRKPYKLTELHKLKW